MDNQWILFSINLIVLLCYFAISGIVGTTISKRKKWLMPLFIPFFLVIIVLVIFYVLEPDLNFYIKEVSFLFDWLNITNRITAYLIYSIVGILTFILGKLIYSLIVLFFKKFPEPFYGRELENGNFELYPKYDIFNAFFKVLFCISLICSLIYSIFMIDIFLAVLNLFTLIVFEIMILFPQKTTEYKEQELIKSINDIDNDVYKNKEEFEKFLQHINDSYEDNDKLSTTGKLRGLEQKKDEDG